MEYLENFVKGKEIFLRFDPLYKPSESYVPAYVFLKNKIFINKEMIRMGFADVQDDYFTYKEKFLKVLNEVKNG